VLEMVEGTTEDLTGIAVTAKSRTRSSGESTGGGSGAIRSVADKDDKDSEAIPVSDSVALGLPCYFDQANVGQPTKHFNEEATKISKAEATKYSNKDATDHSNKENEGPSSKVPTSRQRVN